jgi:hypothetical protein
VVNAQGKFAGTNRVERVGDCFLEEHWAAASGGYTGRSLNSVSVDGKWRQTWTDTSGLRLELLGGLVDGKMVLEGETPSRDPKNPAPTKNRITWTPESGGVVRQHWETSTDGVAWSTAFDGWYHPSPGERSIPEGFFRRIGGAWIGTGVLNRAESHVELRIERTPGSAVRLSWRSVMVTPDGRQVFEGAAAYEAAGPGAFVATWRDSQGAKHPIAAAVSEDGSSLVALWGASGRTVYSLRSDGDLEVKDSIKKPDGSWAEFGRATLKRQ